MILGLSTATFTVVHVLISLIAIGSGFVIMFGLLMGKRLNRWTVAFFAATALTSITGFAFPFHHLKPAHILGIASLTILAFAISARYLFLFAGPWRWIYVVASAFSLYLNFFALTVQSFAKIPALKALAPTRREPPFVVTQLAALVFFVTLTVFAVRRFHPESIRTA